MANKEVFRLHCEAIDTIISVHKFNKREFFKLLKDLEKFIDGKEEDFLTSQEYYIFLINKCIVNGDKLVEIFNCEEDDEEKKEERDAALQSLYECIVVVYPQYNFHSLCNKHNNNIIEKHHFKDSNRIQRKKGEVVSLKNLEEITNLEAILKQEIIGQDKAIEEVINHIKTIAAGLDNIASLFFIGSTGCGKTLLAQLLGKYCYGGRVILIDGASYSSDHTHNTFLGAPPGFIGHGESMLAEKAKVSNQYVFLFDEIEKASTHFHNMLLPLLNDGTITDNNGKKLDFSKSLFLFTSNQGLADYLGKEFVGFGGKVNAFEDIKEDVLKSIDSKFSPEFRNRINEFIIFRTLTEEDAEKIVKLNLDKLNSKQPIEISKELVSYITEKAFKKNSGARDIEKFISKTLKVKLADKMLANPTWKGKYFPVIEEGKIELKFNCASAV